MAEPREFEALVADLSAQEQQMILHDNALVLVGRG
jgi:hypothetical protein